MTCLIGPAIKMGTGPSRVGTRSTRIKMGTGPSRVGTRSTRTPPTWGHALRETILRHF